MNQKRKRRTNAHILEREGVLCTNCWQILEVNCTSRSSVLVITFVIIEILMLVIKRN